MKERFAELAFALMVAAGVASMILLTGMMLGVVALHLK